MLIVYLLRNITIGVWKYGINIQLIIVIMTPITIQVGIKSRFINDLYLLSVLNIQYGYGTHKHKYACHDQCVDRMIMKNIFNNGATKDPVHYLRTSDKKVEYAHIHPNLLNRD